MTHSQHFFVPTFLLLHPLGENGYIRIKRSTDCGYDKTPLDGMYCKFKPDGKINPIHPVKVCGIVGVQYHGVVPIV